MSTSQDPKEGPEQNPPEHPEAETSGPLGLGSGKSEPPAAGAHRGNAGGTNPIPGERYDLRILQSLRRIIRAIDIHSRRLKLKHDITGPQLVCLITIVERGPLTIKAIAGEVFLSPSTVIGVLDRLEAKGLILRLRDTKDRRVVNVSATATGKEVVERAPSPLQEGLARALTNLREIEQATIALSLERIVELMEAEDLPADPILETGQSLVDSAKKRPDAEGRNEMNRNSEAGMKPAGDSEPHRTDDTEPNEAKGQ